MDAVGISETLVPVYHTTPRHNLERCKPFSRRRDNFRSDVFFFDFLYDAFSLNQNRLEVN
jgi:hypothetical protein